MAEDVEVIRKFIDADMHVTPGALNSLRETGDLRSAAEMVLERFRSMPEKPAIVTEELVRRILRGGSKTSVEAEGPVFSRAEAHPEKIKTKTACGKFEPPAADIEPEVEVLIDVTGHSNSQGRIEDFIRLFNDRYERLSRILKERLDMRGAIPIGSVREYEDQTVRIIGMVMDKRETRKRDLIIELEDPTGNAVVFVHKNRNELMRKASEVVTDEVIGVEARVGSDSRRSRLLFVNDIVWPDIPVPRRRRDEGTAEEGGEPIYAALISDLHVGSEMFLEDAFARFLKWLRGESGNTNQRQVAGRVKYLVIAGDLVDGVGIYPNQEEELVIHDINKQYDAVVEYLSQVPEHVKIIVSPGNHDAVRPLEPQPALPKDIASDFESFEPVLVGNPAHLLLHGTKFLIYHGRGFDDLISADSSLDRENSVNPMIKSLKKRHLAPIYGEPMGGRAPIAPEGRDYLVIEEVPDVFHTGHLHVYGCGKYRGVLLVNSATFQERTSYMKRRGVRPTPGIVPLVDLRTRKVRAIHFA